MMPTLAVVDLQKYTRVAVVGDLHGDFKTMQAILGMVDLKADLLVFLGDYADRGPDGVEVIRTVAGLREQCPKNVLPLMGNHEDFSDEGEPKFYPSTIAEEADRKVGSWDTFFRREFKPHRWFISNTGPK